MATVELTLVLCCLLGSVSFVYGQALCELICSAAIIIPIQLDLAIIIIILIIALRVTIYRTYMTY